MEQSSLSYVVNQMKNDTMKRGILCSSIVFPRTESLIQDNPLVVLETNGAENQIIVPEQILAKITASTFSTVGIAEDVRLVVNLLSGLQSELQFQAFDMVDITRSGLVLVRLMNSSNPMSGRSVLVDMTEFHRRSLQWMYPDPAPVKVACITGIIISVVTIVAQYWLSRK